MTLHASSSTGSGRQRFTALPLDDDLTCPVCLEDLRPAMSFTVCMHKVCGVCASGLSVCPLCRATSGVVRDTTLTNVVERAQHLRLYECDRCQQQVTAAARAEHRCPDENARRVDDTFALFHAMAGPTADQRTLQLIVDEAIAQGKETDDAWVAQHLLPWIDVPSATAATDGAGSPHSPSSSIEVTVLIDFDEFAVGYSPAAITTLVLALVDQAVADGFATDRNGVRVVAIGVPFAFRDECVLHALDILHVETHLVARKHDDSSRDGPDRQLERIARKVAPVTGALIIVSSDQDFVPVIRQVRRETGRVGVVHAARQGTLQRRNLEAFATHAHALNDVIPGFQADVAVPQPSVVAVPQQHTSQPQISADPAHLPSTATTTTTTVAATTASGAIPPALTAPAVPQPMPPCAAGSRCPCDSYNGHDGKYCSRTCRDGTPCTVRVHVFAPARCAAHPRCPCHSFTGFPGKHCSKRCRDGTPCTAPTHLRGGSGEHCDSAAAASSNVGGSVIIAGQPVAVQQLADTAGLRYLRQPANQHKEGHYCSYHQQATGCRFGAACRNLHAVSAS
jgi:hypothetical protein